MVGTQGVSYLFRCEHDELALDRVQTLLFVAGEQLVPGSQERVQVGDGPA